jgi:inner membrane transporter RhtA
MSASPRRAGDALRPSVSIVAVAPLLFVCGAIAQYVGAAWAVELFDHVAPESVAWLRVCGAALVLLLVVRPWHREWSLPLVRSAATFGVATALMNMSFYLATDRLPLGTTVAIEFIGPIAVAGLASRSLSSWVSLGLAAIGVVLVSGAQWSDHAVGIAFALAAAACWAGYIVLGERISQRTAGVDGLAAGLALGALCTAPIGIWRSGPAFVHPRWLALCVVIGVFSTIVPYGLDQLVMRRVPLRSFALMLALLPTTAAVVGSVMLSQRLKTIEIAGICAVVLALIFNGMTERRGRFAQPNTTGSS